MKIVNPSFAEAIDITRYLETAESTPWLSEFQTVQRERLTTSVFPTRKKERFKYNDFSALMNRTLMNGGLIRAPQESAPLIEMPSLADHLDAQCLVVVDGMISRDLSTIDPDLITPFSEADESQRQFILSQLQSVRRHENVFTILNHSLLQDGVLVDFHKPVSRPLYIFHLFSDSNASIDAISNMLVRVNTNVEATLIEHFPPQTGTTGSLHSNQVTHCVLHPNAKLNHYRLHLENEEAIHVGEVNVNLHRDANYDGFHIGLGGKIKRLDLNIAHLGAGSNSNLSGIYLSDNHQQIDYHTNVEHIAPHCTSEETFRGIVGGKAKATFNGRIHIHPDAQKSVANLSNKNLLLSDGAEVNTKPELEIYADDVQCSHGATIAKIDEDSLFYLMSRGIDRDKAKLMLNFGFLNELLDKIKHTAIADDLRPMMTSFFS